MMVAMISRLKGTLVALDQKAIVIDIGGVGFEVYISQDTHSSLEGIGKTIELWTHLVVRETALDLYGFKDVETRDFFRLLLSVSGIGPKSALAILDLAPLSALQTAIHKGDAAHLTKVSGIGKKTAQKIILELREKVGSGSGGDAAIIAHEEDRDVLDALTALGYRVNSKQVP